MSDVIEDIGLNFGGYKFTVENLLHGRSGSIEGKLKIGLDKKPSFEAAMKKSVSQFLGRENTRVARGHQFGDSKLHRLGAPDDEKARMEKTKNLATRIKTELMKCKISGLSIDEEKTTGPSFNSETARATRGFTTMSFKLNSSDQAEELARALVKIVPEAFVVEGIEPLDIENNLMAHYGQKRSHVVLAGASSRPLSRS